MSGSTNTHCKQNKIRTPTFTASQLCVSFVTFKYTKSKNNYQVTFGNAVLISFIYFFRNWEMHINSLIEHWKRQNIEHYKKWILRLILTVKINLLSQGQIVCTKDDVSHYTRSLLKIFSIFLSCWQFYMFFNVQ